MKDVKGKLLIIGGHEDKGDYENLSEEELTRKNAFAEEGVLKRFLLNLNQQKPKIELITTASLIPEEAAQKYQDAFKKLKVQDIGIMHITEPDDANGPDILERFRHAHGILIRGGDQNRLADIF